MAPSAYISLVLDSGAKNALQYCIKQVQSSSPVQLEAMANEDMHMTLVFLGSNLKAINSVKRAELHGAMLAFGNNSSTTNLEFEALELFPPTKRNLLIARYRIGGANMDALQKLQTTCFELGLVAKEEHIKSQTDFTAHITLGKFRGMKADQSTLVEKSVRTVSAELDGTAIQALLLPFATTCLRGV